MNRTNREETLDSVFNRISNLSSADIDEIEIEITVHENAQKLAKTEHAMSFKLAQFGNWLTFRDVNLNIKAVLVISVVTSVLLYLIYGLPKLL